MEQDFISWLSSDSGSAVYISVFAMLILGGFGFPIPEDIPLLLAGVAASKGIVSLPSIFLMAYVGVLVADQIVYLIGYYFGQRMIAAGTRSRFFPAITEQKVQEVREGLRKHRLLYILLGRHLFPVRSLTFLTAGSLRIPYLEFFLTDAIAALLSVGIIFFLGYYAGEQLTPELAQHMTHQAHLYILGLVVFSIVAFVLRRFYLKHKATKTINS